MFPPPSESAREPLHHAGRVRPMEARATLEDVENWLVVRLSQYTGIPSERIDPARPISESGLCSRDAVLLVSDLERWAGRAVPVAALWEQGTVRGIAQLVAGLDATARDDWHDVSLGDPPNHGQPGNSSMPIADGGESVAIVGVGCRFPGGRNPESFWRLLVDGGDAVTNDRPRPLAGVPSAGPQGYLADLDLFDPDFFRISVGEAATLDPQQRLSLEVSWEALEDAGIPPSTLEGTATGVFVGICNSDFGRIFPVDVQQNGTFGATGRSLCMAANRISYVLGLSGPSVAVDTACSSSLVAVHQACRSLRSGEVSLALAGGVNLALGTQVSRALKRAGMLASSGRCRTFDAAADGYVRAEGCGMVVLKRLRDAHSDGDRVLAVIRGSSVNQDGRSNGLTAPNGAAQERVVRAALEDAGVHGDEVGYVEAHGTGTPLGDPVEVRALVAALSPGRDVARLCRLGSVKTAIGHAEAAAGIAGLIKVVLMLRHDWIPPVVHLQRLNPMIETPAWLSVPRRGQPWSASVSPRVAGVSSFGFGGTNVHLIVGDDPSPDKARPSADRPQAGTSAAERPLLLTVSGDAPEALTALAASYGSCLTEIQGQSREGTAAGLCRSASAGRDHFRYRAVAIADDEAGLRDSCLALARGESPPGVLRGTAPLRPGGLAFVFTGQGVQFPGMAHSLYKREATFRAALDDCARRVSRWSAVPLLSVIFPRPGDEGLIDRTEHAQAALFAVEYSLAELWRSWGLEPNLVTGHSLGLIVAGCVAGMFSLDDALMLCVRRGRLIQGAPAGAMMAVRASESAVRQVQESLNLDLAAVNASRHVVLSGAESDVTAALALLRSAGLECTRLRMPHPFHSRLLQPIGDAFSDLLQRVDFQAPHMTLVADLDGTVLDGTVDAVDYWQRHLVGTVRFADAIASLDRLGCDTVLEVGPHPVLSPLIAANYGHRNVVASLCRGLDDVASLLTAVGELYVHGCNPNWSKVTDSVLPISSAPTYPFRRTRHWPLPQELEEVTYMTDVPDKAEPAMVAANGDDALLTRLRTILGHLLQTPVPDPDLSFLRLGADSMMLVQIVQSVQREFLVSIPVSRLFEQLDTLRRLAAHIREEAPDSVRSRLASPAPVPAAPAPAKATVVPLGPAAKSAAAAAVDRYLDVHSGVMRQAYELLRGEVLVDAAPDLEISDDQAAARIPTAPPDTFVAHLSQPGDPPCSVDMRPDQLAYIESMVDRYCRWTAGSKAQAFHERPIHADIRNTPRSDVRMRETHYPIAVARSKGARLWDVDGHEYIDLTMGFGVNLFGHGEPFIEEALRRQLESGIQLGPQPVLTGEVARLICRLSGKSRALLCNTGSEAVMVAIRLVRAVTGRSKIVMFAGSYHGSADPVLSRQGMTPNGPKALPLAPGVTEAVSDDTLVLPYGDPASLDVIRERLHELAAVLVEPVQSRNPALQPVDFLAELRRITTDGGVALIFDEVITGFRMHPGGAQALLGVEADVTTYGKVVGGGLPIGVVAGDARYLDAVDGGAWTFGRSPYPEAVQSFFTGTFCKHPLALAASHAVLQELERRGPEIQNALNAQVDGLANRLNKAFNARAVPVRVDHFGSLFRFTFLDQPFRAEVTELFFSGLTLRGLYIWEGRNCFLSTAHTDADVDAVVTAVLDVADELSAAGFFPGAIPIPSDAEYPLADVQREIWFLHQLGAEAASSYNETVVVDIQGQVHDEVLVDALYRVVERHEGLRTCFVNAEVQRPLPAEKLRVARADLGDLPLHVRQATARSWVAEDAARPFDLRGGLLLRASLLTLSASAGRASARGHDSTPGHCQLVLTAHHSVIDGWALSLVLDEIAKLYSASMTGVAAVLEPASQYRAFVAAQQMAAQVQQAEEYWSSELADGLPTVLLPTDQPRPAMVTYAGATAQFVLDQQTRAALRDRCSEWGATPFTVMLAAFSALLHRLTQQDAVVVGVPIACRTHPDGDRTVGNCVNVLPIVSRLNPSTVGADLIAQMATKVTGAKEHASFPLSRLGNRLGSDVTRQQLLPVLFNLNREPAPLRLPETDVEVLIPPRQFVKCDLFVDILDTADGLRFDVEYNRDLFDRVTVDALLSAYRVLLRAMLSDASLQVSDVPLLDVEQRQALEAGCSGAAVPIPGPAVTDLFAQRVAEAGVRSAVVDGDVRLSYAQLDARANRLAHHMLLSGIAPEERIGILLSQSVELVVAILAVLKVGGAYVPLDPAGPEERRTAILADAGIHTLISTTSLLAGREGLGGPDLRLIDLVADRPEIDGAPSSPTAVRVHPDQLCYVLYTSGSSGAPKGVMVSHRSLVNAYLGWERAYRLRDGVSVHLQMANVTFDVFSGDLVRALLSGGSLVLCPLDDLLRPERLMQLLRVHQVQCAEFVPVVVRQLLAHLDVTGEDLSFMKVLIVGSDTIRGEELTHLSRLAGPGAVVVNSYGLTEATIDSTWQVHQPGVPEAGYLIGVPFANVDVHVLDSAGNPVPVGFPGILYVGGPGLARGYLGRPDITAATYLPHTWSIEPGARLLCTGDNARFVRIRGRLVLEYLGRRDGQVKIRGNRVELGEVEASVRALPGVAEAIVDVEPGSDGQPQLVARVCGGVGEPGTEIDEAPSDNEGEGEPKPSLATDAWPLILRDRLPQYMIPERFVLIRRVPLTASGKIDRIALRQLGGEDIDLRAEVVLPRTEVEAHLASVWSRTLGRAPRSVHDSFFALGGHSMSAMQVVGDVMHELGVDLSLRTFFADPTVASMAAEIERSIRNRESSLGASIPARVDTSAGAFPAAPAQRRFWFVEQLWAGVPMYTISCLVRLQGQVEIRSLIDAVGDLVARHDALRSAFRTEGTRLVVDVKDNINLWVPIIDLGGLPPARQEAEIRQLARAYVYRPFDLRAAPLLRVVALRRSERDWTLAVTVAHIVADYWSLKIMLRDLAELYRARRESSPSHLPELRRHFPDVANVSCGVDERSAHLEYWRHRLRGLPGDPALPYERPAQPWSVVAGLVSVALDAELTGRLHAFAEAESVTLHAVLLTAFQVVLCYRSGSEDVVVGAPFADRYRPETHDVVGPLLNTLPVRVGLGGDPSLREAVARVCDATFGAYAHKDVAFEELVEALSADRDGRPPLVTALFQYLPDSAEETRFADLDAAFAEIKPAFVEFDLLFETYGLTAETVGVLRYREAHYDPNTMEEFMRQWVCVLTDLVHDPDLRLSALTHRQPDARLPRLRPARGLLLLGHEDDSYPTAEPSGSH
jgi:amino acid adenylation domain-containing protein